MSNAPNCPACGEPAKLVSGATLYPRLPNLRDRSFYVCHSCDTSVGCHPSSSTPMGMMANASTREARRKAHAAFDALWNSPQRASSRLTRTQAYEWLAKALDLPPKMCHIGMFDEATCMRVVEAVAEYTGARLPAVKESPSLPPPPAYLLK